MPGHGRPCQHGPPVHHLYNEKTGAEQHFSNWPTEPRGFHQGASQGIGGVGGGRECLGAPTSVSVRAALLMSMADVGETGKIVLEDRDPRIKKLIEDHQL